MILYFNYVVFIPKTAPIGALGHVRVKELAHTPF